MDSSDSDISRRTILRGMAASAVLAITGASKAQQVSESLKPPLNVSANSLSRDENYWNSVARYFDATTGIVNLEHGYWGKMSHPVQDVYQTASRMVNAQNSYYARKSYTADHQLSVQRVAQGLAAEEDEIVLTRNATEAVHNLIRQYRGLKTGDAVLYADVDYPSFKTTMLWLKQAYGVDVVKLELPIRANQHGLLNSYVSAFDANPNLTLMLITHVSNQHGLVLPVKAIAAEARKRGIDVICDCAQSWGLIDFKMADLDVDWAAFNLHKWIGSPLGVGALYMRRGTLHKISPYPGEADLDNTDASTRVHTATSNFASILALPAALDFHQVIGPANKQARLNYLRDLWVSEAESMTNIEVLGGTDEESRTGMASFRSFGEKSIEDATRTQKRLENEFGIFTVVRKGLSSGACVRVTPQIFNTTDQIAKLVSALWVFDSGK